VSAGNLDRKNRAVSTSDHVHAHRTNHLFAYSGIPNLAAVDTSKTNPSTNGSVAMSGSAADPFPLRAIDLYSPVSINNNAEHPLTDDSIAGSLD